MLLQRRPTAARIVRHFTLDSFRVPGRRPDVLVLALDAGEITDHRLVRFELLGAFAAESVTVAGSELTSSRQDGLTSLANVPFVNTGIAEVPGSVIVVVSTVVPVDETLNRDSSH